MMRLRGEKSKNDGPALRGVLTALLLGAAAFWLSGCAGYERYPDTSGFHTVVIDAGHGGDDQGGRAVRRQGANEKVLALDVARRLKPILQRYGYHVIMTRNSDVFIPLERRVAIANQAPNSIFVSIHFNHAGRVGANGFESYYYHPRYRRLAANIQTELLKTYRSSNRGVKNARFYVLRNNRRPAVLLELGFLSNPHDNKFAQSAAQRQRLAEAIARGIQAERAGRRP